MAFWDLFAVHPGYVLGLAGIVAFTAIAVAESWSKTKRGEGGKESGAQPQRHGPTCPCDVCVDKG